MNTFMDNCLEDHYTHCEVHVKKEITFGNDMPRIISARTPGLRQATAPIYKQSVDHIYKDKQFIKNLNPDEVANKLCTEIPLYDDFLCLDLSSFDAGQRGELWDITLELVKQTCSEPHIIEFWSSVVHNHNVLTYNRGKQSVHSH